MKRKNKSLRSISYLGKCFLFPMIVSWETLTGLALSSPILLVPSGGRKSTGLFPLIYFRSRGEQCFTLILIIKSEGASHIFPGNNNSGYDLGHFLSSVIVTKASGRAIYILVDL